VAVVELAAAAVEDLDHLIAVLSLPVDTRARVRHALEPLGTFPRLSAELPGQWQRFRFLLGPWRWMILVYVYDDEQDRVVVVTIQDARSSTSPTTCLQAGARQPQQRQNGCPAGSA
jgi:plasmid stabilization system protein ParE